MTRHIVARTSEIPPGGNKVVDVEGRDIVVFRVNDEYFALLNRCPHAGAPLDKAACVARLTSPEPGVYQRSRVGELLRCAWHGWEFDMRNGQSWFDPEAGQGADLSGRDRGRRNARQGALRGRDLSGPRRGQLCRDRGQHVGFRDRWAFRRHCEPTGRREAPPDDRLREAIQLALRPDGLLRRFAPRNDDRKSPRRPANTLPGRLEENSTIFVVRSQNHDPGVISLPGFSTAVRNGCRNKRCARRPSG